MNVVSYEPGANLVKGKYGNCLQFPIIFLNRWKNYFRQLLNVHGVKDVRQTEVTYSRAINK